MVYYTHIACTLESTKQKHTELRISPKKYQTFFLSLLLSYQQPLIFRISIRLSFFIALNSIVPTTRHTADKHGTVRHTTVILSALNEPAIYNVHIERATETAVATAAMTATYTMCTCLYISEKKKYIDVLLWCRY